MAFPNGNILAQLASQIHIVPERELEEAMRLKTAKELGSAIRLARKAQGVTQKDLAGLCNTGVRFIVDLEAGKPNCRLELALKVAANVGVRLNIEEPRK